MGRFAGVIALCAGVMGMFVLLAVTGNVLLALGALPVAALYGYLWERVFGDPYDKQELEGVGPASSAGRQAVADSVYLTAPLGVLILIVAVVTQLILGHYLWAAATVGAIGVAALIAWGLTRREPPRRRRRRRHRNSSS